MKCPLCNQDFDSEIIFTAKKTPVSAGYLKTNITSEEITADIELTQCPHCDYIFNTKFDIIKMNHAYSSNFYRVKTVLTPSMSSSTRAVSELLASYITPDSSILEIGSGTNQLAISLSSKVKKYFTVDPSLDSSQIQANTNHTHYQSFFDDKFTQMHNGEFDIIIFRHLLEHVSNPHTFITNVKSCLKQRGYISVEVPNFDEIYASSRIYDIFHDHFGYFQKHVLINAFFHHGFQLSAQLQLYNNQHMHFIFKHTDSISNIDTTKEPKINKDKMLEFYSSLNLLKSKIDNTPKPIAIWGAGAHGNILAAYLGFEYCQDIKACLDKDTKKNGLYLAQGQIPIIQPVAESINKFKTILIASSLHENEINTEIYDMGFTGTVIKTANNNIK